MVVSCIYKAGAEAEWHDLGIMAKKIIYDNN